MKRIGSPDWTFHTCRAERSALKRNRRGSFFHYILVYMTVASALLTIAGVCLHSILKADVSERRESLFLNSMLRAEHQLRVDSQSNGFVWESATSVSVTSLNQTIIRWESDRGFLTRRETRGTEVVSSDRFVFPAGSQITMLEGSGKAITVRITEPSVFVTYSELANGGSNRSKPSDEAIPATPAHVAQPGVTEIHLKGATP